MRPPWTWSSAASGSLLLSHTSRSLGGDFGCDRARVTTTSALHSLWRIEGLRYAVCMRHHGLVGLVAGIAVLLVALNGPPAWGRRGAATTLTLQGDLCNRVCQFSLCVGEGKRPPISLCTPAEADMTFLVASVKEENRLPRIPRLKIRGATVRLECRADLLAACQLGCATDEDCQPNFAPSHCVDGQCQARPSCP